MNIKPIESYNIEVYSEALKDTPVCKRSEVRELEANYKEVIEALVDEVRFIDRYIINVVMIDIEYNDYMSRRDVLTNIIEKATGLPLEDLIK